MVSLAGLLVSAPTGLWEKIIFAMNGTIKSYALVIVLLTLCLKLLMYPLEFLNRKSSMGMTETQAKIQPKINKIKEQYKDPNLQNQKLSELYKKEGFNPMGSCLAMLGYMVLSLTVFISLFSGLNNMAAYKIATQYDELQNAYVQEYVTENNIEFSNEFTIEDCIIQISTKGETESQEDYEIRLQKANDAVKAKYALVKESFLWVKNVWMPDNPTSKAIPDFNSYVKTAKLSFENDEQKELSKNAYNAVMVNLEQSEGVNGYFILPVFVTGLTFLSQYLATRKKKKKENFYTQNNQKSEQELAQEKSGKTMLVVMPIIMLVFALGYNSIFTLYLATSQAVTALTTPLTNLLINKTKKNK